MLEGIKQDFYDLIKNVYEDSKFIKLKKRLNISIQLISK